MKKIITITALVLTAMSSPAQVISKYLPSVEVATYEEITDGTVVPHQQEGATWDNLFFTPSGISNGIAYKGAGFPIGFDVIYNGQTMNQFGIAAHGFITLGKDQVKMSALNNPSFFPFDAGFHADYQNIIGFTTRGHMGASANTEISYKVMGEAPQRELVVQYKDVTYYQESFDVPPLKCAAGDLQIRVCETGDIRIVFHDFALVDTYSPRHNFDAVRLGIQGTNRDHLIKTDDFLGNGFSPEPSKEFDWDNDNPIPDGLTYTFQLPDACVTPTQKTTVIELTAETDAVSSTFTRAADGDHTLVLLTTGDATPTLPADGETYKPGTMLGGATVVAYTEEESFSTRDAVTLQGGQRYALHFYAVQANCTGGPVYGQQAVVKEFVTKAEAPAAVTLAACAPNALTIDVTANATANDILVAYTVEPFIDSYQDFHARGRFGQPTDELAVGSTIEGGGTVVYAGVAREGIVVEGLPAGVPVFVAVWSKDANGYSTTKKELITHTVATLPWQPNFDQSPVAAVPVGWWSTNDGWQTQYDQDKKGYLDNRDFVTGAENYLVTPLIDLAKGNILVQFDAMLYVWGRFGNSPWTPAVNDYLCIDYRVDGTNEWVNAVTWQADKLPELIGNGNDYTTWKGIFTMVENKRVQLRLNIKTTQAIRGRLHNFKVETTTEGGDGPTPEPKECVTPTDLTVSDITDTSVKLSWAAGDNNLTWNVRYRESTATTYTELNALTTTAATLNDLKAETPYVWQVKATCEENESNWSGRNKFTTTATGIETIGIEGVQAFLNGNILNVVNPAGSLISSIQVYTTDGKLMGTYRLASTDNAFIRLPRATSIVVKVNGPRHSKTLKLSVR